MHQQLDSHLHHWQQHQRQQHHHASAPDPELDAAWAEAGLGPAAAPAPAPAPKQPTLWEPPAETSAPPQKPKPKPKPKPRKPAASAAASEASKGGGGVLMGVDLDAIMPKVGESRTAADVEPRLIVLDAPNIAMRHGERGSTKRFSCRGIEIAIEYYQKLGHKVIGFLQDYHLNYEDAGKQKRAAELGVGHAPASKRPDDVALLKRLQDRGLLVGCPSWNYDDSYCIKYAQQHEGSVIITNDLYRDNVNEGATKNQQYARKQWFRAHCCSYIFVGDDFVPNPDFKFPPLRAPAAD